MIHFDRRAFNDIRHLMTGNAAESAMRFGAFLVYSRALTPTELGMVAVVIAIVHFANALTDFGIDTAAISLGSKAFGENDQALLSRYACGGFRLHVWLATPMMLLGAVVASHLAHNYFKDGSLTWPLVAAAAGLPLLRLAEYNLSVLRMLQRFRFYPLPGIVETTFLLVSLLYLSSTDRITVGNVLILVLFAAPLLKFLVGLLFLPLKRLHTEVRRTDLRELLSFGKWVWGSSLLETGTRRANVLLLQALAGYEATGHFNMAARYSEFLALVFEPLRKYLLPKFTAIDNLVAMRRSLHHTYAWLLWTLLLIPAAWLAAPTVFLRTQGAEWLPAVTIFRVLVVGRLLFLLSKPLTFALYSMNRPQELARIHLLAAAVYLIVAPILIYRQQAVGSALSLLFLSATILILLYWYVRKALDSEPAREST